MAFRSRRRASSFPTRPKLPAGLDSGLAFLGVYLTAGFWLLFHPALLEPRSLAAALGGGLVLLFLARPALPGPAVAGTYSLAFLAYAPLTAFWAASPGTALQSSGFLFLGALLFLLFGALTPAARERIREWALLGVMAACLMAILQRFTVFGGVEKWLPALAGEDRDIVTAAVHHKRVFGPLVTPGALAALILLFLPDSLARWRRPLHAAALVLLVPALLFTGSVGALAVLVVAWFLVLFLGGRRGSSLLVAAAGVLAVAGAVAWRGGAHWSASSLGARLDLWVSAIRMWLARPFFGWGWGHFEEAYRAMDLPLSAGSRFAHNLLLQVLVEGGAVGAILLLLACIGLVRRFRSGVTGEASLTGALALLLFSLLDIPFVMPVLVWFFPLFASEALFRDDPVLRKEWTFPAERMFWPVMAVCAFVGFFPPFRPWSLALGACVLLTCAASSAAAPRMSAWMTAGLGYFAVRAFLSPSSLGASRFLTCLALAGAFLLWAGSLRRPEKAAGVLLALPLLWSARAWWETAALVPVHGWGALRVPLSWLDYSNPRTLAIWLAPLLVLVFAGAMFRKGRLAVLLAGGASLLRLWSLAALAGLTAAAATLLGGRGRHRRAWILLVAGVALVLGLRLLNTSDTKWSRLDIWKTAVQAWAEAPLAGVGPGVFPQVFDRIKPPREGWACRYLMGTPAAHSDPLDLLTAFGVLGLFLAGAGLVSWWRSRRDPVRRAAAVSLAVPSLFQMVFHSPHGGMLGAILLSSWKEGSEPGRSRPLKGFLALGLGLSLFGAAAFQAADMHRALASQREGRLPDAYRALRSAAPLDAWDARSYEPVFAFEEEMFLRTGDDRWKARSDATFDRMSALEPRDGHWSFVRAMTDSERALRGGRVRVGPDVERAGRSWEEARKARPTSANTRYEEGWFWMRAGRKDLAVRSFGEAVSLEPFFARAWMNLGNLRKESGDRTGAAEAYRRALDAASRWRGAPLAPPENEMVLLPPEAETFARRELDR